MQGPRGSRDGRGETWVHRQGGSNVPLFPLRSPDATGGTTARGTGRSVGRSASAACPNLIRRTNRGRRCDNPARGCNGLRALGEEKVRGRRERRHAELIRGLSAAATSLRQRCARNGRICMGRARTGRPARDGPRRSVRPALHPRNASEAPALRGGRAVQETGSAATSSAARARRRSEHRCARHLPERPWMSRDPA